MEFTKDAMALLTEVRLILGRNNNLLGFVEQSPAVRRGPWSGLLRSPRGVVR